MLQHIQSEGEFRDLQQRDQLQNSKQLNLNRNKQCKLIRLCFQEFISRKNNCLKFTELQTLEKKQNINNFHLIKDLYYQKGVKKFKDDYLSGEEALKKRKRMYSIDNDVSGAYYFNNWISIDAYLINEKPSQEEKTASIVYEIIAQEWTKALEILSSLPKTPEFTTLHFILKGFKCIQTILNEDVSNLKEHFIKRQAFEIRVKYSGESIGGVSNFINVFEQNAISKFMEIKSFLKKVQYLKSNLQFLVNFAHSYKVVCNDDYVKLIFIILGNCFDQEDAQVHHIFDYSKILLDLDIKLQDRLNFAIKLLTERKRKTFCAELQTKLCDFAGLDNILFFLNSSQKNREQSISKICRNYIDKYSDIETVAYLSYEFPFLKKYYFEYRQLLQFTNQSKQLQRLDNYAWHGKETLKELMLIKNSKKHLSYFDFINIAEQKIFQHDIKRQSFSICDICTKKMLPTENFLSCGKCQHGGHANHLLKWFQESENCPHIGCACLCN